MKMGNYWVDLKKATRSYTKICPLDGLLDSKTYRYSTKTNTWIEKKKKIQIIYVENKWKPHKSNIHSTQSLVGLLLLSDSMWFEIFRGGSVSSSHYHEKSKRYPNENPPKKNVAASSEILNCNTELAETKMRWNNVTTNKDGVSDVLKPRLRPQKYNNRKANETKTRKLTTKS